MSGVIFIILCNKQSGQAITQTTHMNFTNMMLSELSQSQKETHCIIPLDGVQKQAKPMYNISS